MFDYVIHVGAHRTGTTQLQSFCTKNAEMFASASIDIVQPPITRENISRSLVRSNVRTLYSEENLLGTMEENVIERSLYPKIVQHLSQRNPEVFNAQALLISIREIGQWWSSALAYLIVRGQPIPSEQHIEEIAQCSRSWSNVIDELIELFPRAQIFVREHEWHKGNPKRFLQEVTKWPEFKLAKQANGIRNASPSTNKIAEALANRGRYTEMDKLSGGERFVPFSPHQLAQMKRRYLSDIKKISEERKIHFIRDERSIETMLGKTTDSPAAVRAISLTPKVLRKPKICFLHIGKTGGTFIKNLVSESTNAREDVFLGGHADTLTSTIGKFGSDRKLAFFFREPSERFISGFLSRLAAR